MRVAKSLLGITAAIPATALAADTVQLTAGRWEEVTTITGLTLGGKAIALDAMPNRVTTKLTCISAEEALDPAKRFLKPDSQNRCEPGGTVSGGRIALQGTCTDSKFGRMIVTGAGTYQPKSYEVSARLEGRAMDLPAVITMGIKARHVGICTGAETD
jgi:hypothetical protein